MRTKKGLIMTNKITNNKNLKKLVAVAISAALTVSMLGINAMAAEVGTQSTDAQVSFEAGKLEFLNTPELNFGNHAIPGRTEDYILEMAPGDLTVSDLRGGAQGWKVTVSLDSFENAGTTTLDGSTVTFNNGISSPGNGTTGISPILPSQIVLTSNGGEVQVYSAPIGYGAGVWNATWSLQDVKLTVYPGTAMAGTSVANLNWSLNDTP